MFGVPHVSSLPKTIPLACSIDNAQLNVQPVTAKQEVLAALSPVFVQATEASSATVNVFEVVPPAIVNHVAADVKVSQLNNVAQRFPVFELNVKEATVFGSIAQVAETANNGKHVVSVASLAAVTVQALPVILHAIALVTSKSVNHPFKTLVQVAPSVQAAIILVALIVKVSAALLYRDKS